MIPRLPDWESRMVAVLESRRHTPFQWGKNDCAFFTLAVLRATTGVEEIAHGISGTYTSAIGASRVLSLHGGLLGLARKICAEHGWVEVSTRLAMRGDPMFLFGGTYGVSLVICDGAGVLGPGEAGLVSLPRSQASTAWRVPFVSF